MRSPRVWLPLALLTCVSVAVAVSNATFEIACLPTDDVCTTRHSWSVGPVLWGVALGLTAGLVVTAIVYVARKRIDGWFTPPPGRLFHLLAAGVAVVILGSFSYPGFDFFAFLMGALCLVGLGAWWFVALIVQCVRRAPYRERFLFAPIGVVLLVGLLAVSASLHLRWRLSQGNFDHVVTSLQRYSASPGGDDGYWSTVDLPGRIGSYCISSVRQVPGGYLFEECHGSLFDDAGFGWFPNTPDAEKIERSSAGGIESPEFLHLGGPWYAWTAGW